MTSNSFGEQANKERVMVVEDNVLSQKLTQVLLEKEGYEVCIADDGMEALSLLETFRPNLILMDVQLPTVNGIELTRLIRSDAANAHISIIALTAHGTDEWRRRALEAGCDTYMTKPISIAALRGVIAQTLKGTAGSRIEFPVVDEEALMLRLDGDRNLLKELQQLLVEECPRLKADLHRHLEAHNNAALANAAHTLKGMMSTFSAIGAEHAAQALELAGAAGDLTAAAGALESVDEQVELVLKSLAEMVSAA